MMFVSFACGVDLISAYSGDHEIPDVILNVPNVTIKSSEIGIKHKNCVQVYKHTNYPLGNQLMDYLSSVIIIVLSFSYRSVDWSKPM